MKKKLLGAFLWDLFIDVLFFLSNQMKEHVMIQST